MAKLSQEEVNHLSIIYLQENFKDLNIKSPKDCFDAYIVIKEQIDKLNYPNGHKMKLLDKKSLGP